VNRKKLVSVLVLLTALASGQNSNEKTPARRFQDDEKEKAVLLTLVRVDTKQNVWVLRNSSDWYLNSVSFVCDTSDSNDERFMYMPADGAWIAPWEDVKVAKGKEAPWGFGFPGDTDFVRHMAGARQDVLDAETAHWYIRSQRVFNCRTTDVDIDHKLVKERAKKSIGGPRR
jgi:hypothetical protein